MGHLASSANQAAVSAEHVPYVLLIDFDFPAGHLRVSSWDRDFTFGGNTYYGTGDLLSMGEIAETSSYSSDPVQFTMSTTSSEAVTAIRTQNIRGRSVVVYHGTVDASTYQLVDTPEQIWEGRMDTYGTHYEEGSRTMYIVAENRMVIYNDSIGLMYADAHQKARVLSTDQFFNQIAAIANKTVTWGNRTIGVGQGMSNAVDQVIGSFLKKWGFGFL